MTDQPRAAFATFNLIPQQLTLHWMQGGPEPIPVNSFAVQLTPDGVVFVGGFANAPLFNGTSDEQASQAAVLKRIEITPSVRVLIGFHNLPLLVEALSQALEIVKQQQSAALESSKPPEKKEV